MRKAASLKSEKLDATQLEARQDSYNLLENIIAFQYYYSYFCFFMIFIIFCMYRSMDKNAKNMKHQVHEAEEQ